MHRKFTADNIFNGYSILPAGNVLITEMDGTVLDIVPAAEAGDNIETFTGLLCPGFINTHCHTELSHLKGLIPERTGLVSFVQQVMWDRMVPYETVQQAIKNAEQEMYNGGIVAVGDICNTANSAAIKSSSKLFFHNFIEVSGFVDAVAKKRLQEMEQVYQKLVEVGRQHNNSYSPHAPYSVSKTLFALLNAATIGKLTSMHSQECMAENELYQNKTGQFLTLFENLGIDISEFKCSGQSSLQTVLPYLKSPRAIILVHNTFTSQQDIEFIKIQANRNDQKIYHCLCVNANRYIENAFPPVDLLIRNDCTIVLGTDSYASNFQLNILEEMKTIQQETNGSVSLNQLLQWATLNGAAALQQHDRLGSFEKGKKPGIVQINKVELLQLTADSTAKRIF